jgi:hypothetical protein
MEDDDPLPEIQSEKEPRKEKLSSTISPYLKKVAGDILIT